MAGASDPLEDMLFNEVDEKAVSDLVGSLESQLGDRKSPAASYSDGKREAAPASAGQFSGKVRDQVGSLEQPQQGHPAAGLTQEPGANEPLSGKTVSASTSSVAAGAVIAAGAGLQVVGAPPSGPGPVTLPTQSGGASFHRAPVLSPSAAPGSTVVPAGEALRTVSPGLQSLNGGAVKLVNSAAGTSTVISTVTPGGSAILAPMASQPGFQVPQSSAASPTVTLQRHPSPGASVAQNGVDPKVGPLVTQGAPSPSASTSQVMNHSNPLMHTKLLVPSLPVSGSSVILASSPPPPAAQSSISQTQTGTSTAAIPLAAVGVKPAVNGVAQPAVAVVRTPGAPVVATSIQQQRPGLVASPTRAAAPQPPLAVRPQQQTTIQLPPGFTMPAGEKTQGWWWRGGVTCWWRINNNIMLL